jgi:adenine/guanine phosphoribosyltransferase-like PRPP-binding protein
LKIDGHNFLCRYWFEIFYCGENRKNSRILPGFMKLDPNPYQLSAPPAPAAASLSKVLRFSYFNLVSASDLSVNAAREYSRMKYGDPDATHSIAERMTDLLINSPEFKQQIPENRRILLASSAFGSIPTAAFALAREMQAILEQEGFEVVMVKLQRRGGFARTDYGSLNFEERLKVLKKRKISISPEDHALLEGGTLLVVDDLRSTGAHELALEELLLGQTGVQNIVFAYWIAFEAHLRTQNPMQEETINHSNISYLDDLLPFFSDAQNPPYLNSRVLKFMLLGGLPAKTKGPKQSEATGERNSFFRKLPLATCLRIYQAALSRDGYCSQSKFRPGILILEALLLEKGALTYLEARTLRMEAEGKTVLHSLVLDEKGQFTCEQTGDNLTGEIARYSRFKFGDVDEIQYFGKQLADKLVGELEKGGQLTSLFERVRSQGEYIYLQAPGYRNVVSASNYLLREVAARVNVWLSLRGLPTMIVKPLTRLASGRSNYAELSAGERTSRKKTTQSLLPAQDYRDYPIHVIFLDDVEVTGATADRARKQCRKAGAMSFQSVFAFQIQPELAENQAGIEHSMNQFAVSGKLDQVVAGILAHPDYQPVQRMLRMLLHPDNRIDFGEFGRDQIPNHSLLRVYSAAMANDYLWINPDGDRSDKEPKLGEYGPSLMILRELMIQKGLLDKNGLLV